MKQETPPLTLSLSLFLIAIAALFIGLEGAPAKAQGPTTRYVAPGGDCGGATPCYATIKAAVDAASHGDTIKVAQSVYTSTGFQVVYINKAITVTGGYTTTDWTNSYPLTQTTVIDAENVERRRGVYIDGTGVTTITLSGLTIQGGYAQDADGGGVYVLTGTVVLRNSHILSNAAPAGEGGGLGASGWTLVITGNVFEENSALAGGGIGLGGDYSLASVLVNENILEDNSASSRGGAVFVASLGSAVVISANTIQYNSAHEGGGVLLYAGTVTLTSNSIISNTALHRGGGVYVYYNVDKASLSENTISDNAARDEGGAICVNSSTVSVTLRQNRLLHNASTGHGSALAIVNSNPATVSSQNDIIANSGSCREAVYLTAGLLRMNHCTLVNNGEYALTTNGGSATLTNTIVASHTVGGLAGNNIVADHILFFNTGVPCSSGASCSNSVSGDQVRRPVGWGLSHRPGLRRS